MFALTSNLCPSEPGGKKNDILTVIFFFFFYTLMESHLSFLFGFYHKLTPCNDVYVGSHFMVRVRDDI